MIIVRKSEFGEKQSLKAEKWRAEAQGKAKEEVKIFDIWDMVQKSIVQKLENSEVREKQSREAGKWRATAQGKSKEQVKISDI